MEQGSDILETNPTIQMRFEELEEWRTTINPRDYN